MSPVVNKSTAPATTQAQPSNPTPPLASATAAATTGAAAGDTSRRAAEQQRLRRILDTVARQEPGLSWAAGLRDNGQTTLLVTDLASGWIPHTFAYPPTSPCSNRPPTPPRHRHRPTGHHHRSRGTPPPRLPQPTRPRHTRTHRRPHSTHRTHNRRTRTHPGRNGTPPRHTAPHRPSRSSGRHPQLRRPRQRNRPPTPQNHRDPPSRTDHLPQPRHRHGSPRLDRQRRLLTCSGVHRHGSCNSLTRVTNTPTHHRTMDTNPPPSAAAFTQLAVGGRGQRRDCRGCAGCRSFNRGTDAPDEQRSSHRRWNDRRADIHRSRNRRGASEIV